VVLRRAVRGLRDFKVSPLVPTPQTDIFDCGLVCLSSARVDETALNLRSQIARSPQKRTGATDKRRTDMKITSGLCCNCF
jgi:hypothetical protein